MSGMGKRLFALDERVFRLESRRAAAQYDAPAPRWANPSAAVGLVVGLCLAAAYLVVAITVSPWLGLPIIVVPSLAYAIAVVTWSRRHRQMSPR
jgi:hypothetical protein